MLTPYTQNEEAQQSIQQTPPPPPPPPPPKPSKFRQVTHMGYQCQSQDEKQQQQQQHLPMKTAEAKSIGFTMWAHNLGYAAALSNIVYGIIATLWAREITERPDARSVLFAEFWAGYYCIVLGVVFLFLERKFGRVQVNFLYQESTTEPGRSPLRAVLYVLFSLGCFFSYPTMLSGFVMWFAAVANYLAYLRREFVEDTKPFSQSLCFCDCTASKQPVHEESDEEETITVWDKCKKMWHKQEEIGRAGQLVFIMIYILINIILFFQRLFSWMSMVSELQEGCTASDSYDCVSSFAPWAKAFGQTLNFNCSLLLLPVLRTFIRKLNNLQFDNRVLQRYTPPLRKNVVFHKFVAIFVLVGAVGHVFFHFLNLWKSPEATMRAFSVSALVTGYLITLSMYIIYSAAQNRVKRAHYEIFWLSHHAFILFFACLLAHGPKIWAWCGIPLLAYAFERWYRDYKSRKVFYVAKVVYKKPVMCLSFFPEDNGFTFKEGQYLHLLCPTLSRNEWHPFTISSPHEDLEKRDGETTLHIRVQGEGSWTWKFCKMFEEMAPSSAKQDGNFNLALSHLDGQGISQRGKYLGPDGLPLIMVDGPHAAPAQHYSEYNEIILVGAGIGLTPSSSIIQSILKHKWKKGFKPETIYFVFVVRHSEIFSFRWFIKLLTEMEKSVASDYAAGNLNAERHRIQIHIFVTRAPKTESDISRQASIGGGSSLSKRATRQAGLKVNIGFEASDLEVALLNPKVNSSQLVNLIGSNTNAPNKMQDIWIWNGRPSWTDLFSYAKLKRQPTTDKIGVCFCGTSIIGKDLKKYCQDFSSLQDNCTFDLHKENF